MKRKVKRFEMKYINLILFVFILGLFIFFIFKIPNNDPWNELIKGNLNKSKDLFLDKVNSTENNYLDYLALGRIYRLNKEYDLAKYYYNQSILKNKNDNLAYLGLAQFYISQNNPFLAKQYLDIAKTKSIDSYYYLIESKYYFYINKTSLALESYNFCLLNLKDIQKSREDIITQDCKDFKTSLSSYI